MRHDIFDTPAMPLSFRAMTLAFEHYAFARYDADAAISAMADALPIATPPLRRQRRH